MDGASSMERLNGNLMLKFIGNRPSRDLGIDERIILK
jgi:hypothetical protein